MAEPKIERKNPRLNTIGIVTKGLHNDRAYTLQVGDTFTVKVPMTLTGQNGEELQLGVQEFSFEVISID